MKLVDILEHEIVPKDRLKSRIFWKIPKMLRTEPPFTKRAFYKLRDVTGGKQIKDPVGGKVLKKSNTMKYGEYSKPQKSKSKNKKA